jgi:riboflavin-specific deaminase-like protein
MAMRQLFPDPVGQIDPYDACRPDDPAARRVRLNFVASLNGTITDEQGRSGGLGGEGDRAMFRALRAWADAIMVGAGTVRIEGYGPHRLTAALAERRAADGRHEPAAIVVVSRLLDFDLSTPLFTEARTPTVVLTCAAAPTDRQSKIASVARLIVAGDKQVNLAEGLDRLAAEGLRAVLCEGGPRLAESLLDPGLIDELWLTLAPALIGRAGPTLVASLINRIDLELSRIFTDGVEVFLRYALQNSRSSAESNPRSAS